MNGLTCVLNSYLQHPATLIVNLSVGGAHERQQEKWDKELGDAVQRGLVLDPENEVHDAPDHDEHDPRRQPALQALRRSPQAGLKYNNDI